MKNNTNISFDELVKSAFEGAQSTPPPGVWEGVASQVGVSAGASIAKTAFLKTIAGKILVSSVVVALTAVGLVKVFEEPSNNNPNEESTKTDVQIVENSSRLKDAENQNGLTEEVLPESKMVDNSLQEGIPALKVQRDNPQSNGKTKALPNGADVYTDNNVSSPNRVNANNLASNGLMISSIDSVYCIGEAIQLHAYYQPVWEDVVKVNSGATLINASDKNWVVSYSKPGKYQVALIAVKNGIKYNTTKNIYIEDPKADFNVKHASNGITLTAVNSSALNYKWSINNIEYKNTKSGTLYIPYSDFNKASNVDIQLEIQKGKCSDIKTNQVVLPKEEKELFIPNVFTPTVEDGKNDCFKISIEEPIFYYLVIKNRNGKIVFETMNSEECWNGAVNNMGEKCAPDAYFYQLIYQKENREKKTLTGRVQLF